MSLFKFSRESSGTSRVVAGWFAAVSIALVAAPVAAQSTLKVYRSYMPDGTVVLSDKPTAGAEEVESSTYLVTEPRERGVAEAERDYWRRQSESFDRRQMLREGGPGRSARQWSTRDDGSSPASDQYGAAGQDGGYYFGGGQVARPLVSLNQVPRVYESSPGAVRGRGAGFIGSGFSTAR